VSDRHNRFPGIKQAHGMKDVWMRGVGGGIVQVDDIRGGVADELATVIREGALGHNDVTQPEARFIASVNACHGP
jgi:hypothetical protein